MNIIFLHWYKEGERRQEVFSFGLKKYSWTIQEKINNLAV